MLPTHERYELSMIDERPVYDWPDGKRLAMYVGTNIESFAFGAGVGSDPAHGEAGLHQNQRNYAWRDYGLRIGVWRMFDLLDEFAIPAAHNASAMLYEQCPEIMDRIRDRGDEVVGHGRTQSERQGGMWTFDEARMIQNVTQTIARHEGSPPTGWMGPGMSHSPVTIDLLKEAGYQYLMDWCCDDQPFWMKTRSGSILSLPYSLEVNDSIVLLLRQQTTREFADMIIDQFEEMIEQCTRQPLVFTFAIHAHVMGQPFRLKLLREVFEHITNHPRRDLIWFTHPRDIAKHVMALPAASLPGSAA